MAVNGKQEPRVSLFRQGLGWPGVSKPRGPPAPAEGSPRGILPSCPGTWGRALGLVGGHPATTAFSIMVVAATSGTRPQGVLRIHVSTGSGQSPYASP